MSFSISIRYPKGSSAVSMQVRLEASMPAKSCSRYPIRRPLANETSPESGFVKSTVCERFVPNGLVMLRGAVLRDVRASGVTTHTVQDAAEYERVLRERFDLAVPGIDALWPSVWARHLKWQAEEAASVGAR